jgi:hypothetical protein
MGFFTRAEINGTIDTNSTVLANLNKIAGSSQSFVTWDPNQGKWTTILNKTGSSVMTFDDSNIVGSINVTGAGVDDAYNSVKVQFNSKDQSGATDERVLSVAAEDREPNELDNQLNLTFDLINDPAQAELLGAIEMLQSRVDTIVEFATDFRAIGLRAGEIIGVANNNYFFQSETNPKLFRVVSIEEVDTEDGGILLSITAIEYDSQVYSTSNLTRENRITDSGIVPAAENVCIFERESIAAGKKIADALNTTEGRAALTGAGISPVETFSENQTAAPITATFNDAYSNNKYYFDETVYGGDPFAYGNGYYFQWLTAYPVNTMSIDFEGPQATYNYTVDGATKSITAGVPVKLDLYYRPAGFPQWFHAGKRFMEWSSYISKITVMEVDVPNIEWLLWVTPLGTFDLNATDNNVKPTLITNMIEQSGTASGITVSAFLN